MHTVFIGLEISFIYGALSSYIVYSLRGISEFQLFVAAYISSFNTLISLGLILGTALIVFLSQHIIPETIEKSFEGEQLKKTSYYTYRRRFLSLSRSVTFAASFVIVGFFLFYCCQFPLPRLAEALMIIPACAQYALGVYVGRKLCYAGLMLYSLQRATVTRNLFKDRELDEINSYVHIVSTLTVIFIYVHVLGYYEGPFLYHTILGKSVKSFLLLPAVIATPVLLIFSFYPRVALQKIYRKSIDLELKILQETLRSEELSPFEKKSYLIAFDKMSREELRHSLQLTLSDLPIGITILIMILQPILGK